MPLPTYVLVHGAFANAAIWSSVQRELAFLGHRSLAVELPGHGWKGTFPAAYQAPQDLEALATTPGSIAGVTLKDNADHVIEAVRKTGVHGPVILVGHSRGGLTLNAVGNAVPDLLQRIVYASAWCCVDLTPAGYTRTPQHGTSALDDVPLAGDPGELGLLRQNFRTADRKTLAIFRETFYADATDDEFFRFLNSLDTDENLDVGGPEDRAQADTWGRIKRSYVRFTKDNGVPIALQDRYIREADAMTPGNPFDVHTIEASHLKPLVDGHELATILAGLA